ncbi:MAG TPA: class I SAM-dependent methyltransferase [Desulfomonilia bacterium]
MDKMEGIKTHFDEEAEEYDGIIRKLMPYYTHMVKTIADCIPFKKDESIEVIDLGCGTGTISKAILDIYPNARFTCVDMAPRMLKMAERKLCDAKGARYINCDFYQFEFDKRYDVVVSSLALHHLVTDDDKMGFYRKISDSVKPGGIFINGDVVLASYEWLHDMYLGKWKEYMSKSVPMEEIEKAWMPLHFREDSPISMMKHLEMLKEAGFNTMDIVWKYYNVAVYLAMK